MTEEQIHESRLAVLRKLFPVKALMRVGVGRASCLARYGEWEVERLFLVDVHEERLRRVMAEAEPAPGWEARVALLAAETGEVSCHVASNPLEGGLVAPEELAFLWPNLRAIETRSMEATTIDQLAREFGIDGELDWLCVDCFPAMELLRGARDVLSRLDVLEARVVRARAVPDDLADLLGEERLDDFMRGQGFARVGEVRERHPAVIRALYARDWKNRWHVDLRAAERLAARREEELNAQLAESREREEKNEALIARLHEEEHALREQLDAQRERAEELASQLEEARQGEKALQARVKELEASLAEADREREGARRDLSLLEKKHGELGKKLTALEEERDGLRKKLAALEEERDGLRKKLTALEGERDGLRKKLAALEEERDGLRKKLAALEGERDGLRKKLAALKVERGGLRKKLVALEEKRNELRKRLEGRVKANRALEQSLKTEKREREEENRKLRERLQGALDRAERAEKQVLLKVQDLEELRRKFGRLKDEHDRNAALLEKLREALPSLNSHIRKDE